MRVLPLYMFGTILSVLFGCSGNPSTTQNYPSSSPLLSLVVENFEGNGPLSSDTTRIYAVRKSSEKTVKQLIIEGEYLGLSHVDWRDVDQVELCISPDSMTSIFYNNVTLSDGSTSMNIHTVLVQSCSK